VKDTIIQTNTVKDLKKEVMDITEVELLKY